MNAVLKAGIGLAVLVQIFSVIMMATGILLSNPMMGGLIFLVVAIGLNIAAIWWGLSQTAAESGYGKQLLNGLLIGLVAAVIIFALSLLTTTVLFPDYIEESKLATIEMLENMEMPDEVREAQIEGVEAQTASAQARNGAIGTVVTSLFFGAIIAIFKRKK